MTRANLEGFYYRPRIDNELLAEHAEGLICLSACISGIVPSLVERASWTRRARDALVQGPLRPRALLYRTAAPRGVPELERINAQLVELAREVGLRCVATNDVHYARQGGCRRPGAAAGHPDQHDHVRSDRMRMGSDDYFLTSADEMATLMAAYPEAVENSLDIAEQCNVDPGRRDITCPVSTCPRPHAGDLSAQAVRGGLQGATREITPEIQTRLDYELGVIHEMGFDDYFLINDDLVRWAKHEAKMLVGPGRGSGASSLVAYALGITDLEPLEPGPDL